MFETNCLIIVDYNVRMRKELDKEGRGIRTEGMISGRILREVIDEEREDL